MSSTLKIQFGATPQINDYIKLKASYGVNGLLETFVSVRTSAYKSPVGGDGAASAQLFLAPFQADHNTISLFTIIRTGEFVEITHPDDGFFTAGEFENGTSGEVSFVSVVDVPDVPPINITDISFSQATNACADVKIDVTTDVLADIVRVNGTPISVGDSNILLHSESADNAVWNDIAINVTPNDLAYPSGGYFADKIIPAAVSGLHVVQQSLTKDTSTNNYTLSCIVKADELQYLVLFIQGTTGASGVALIFDTATQTFDGLIESGGYSLLSSGFSEPETGWYRVHITFTSNTDTDIRPSFGATDSATIITSTGDGTSGLHIRAMQIQEGNLTPYVETTTTPILGGITNPFSFEWVRGAFINLEVENSDGETDNENIQLPKVLSASSTTINVLNSPSGATITILVGDSDGLILQYSLDDITYQASNVFTNITEGSYTAYVQDDLGCEISAPFEVPNFEDGGVGVSSSYSDLPSKSNSIRFARRVTWADCTNYKNDENTLSCELAHTKNPRHINQLFQDCDVITTQIRSNYENNVVTVIQEDGTETLIPVNQKSANIGLKDKRDAIKYNVGNDQTGIYFTSGDTYDFDTDVVNGSYTLNGGLPNWGFIGSYITLAGVWFQVQDIIFDESKNAEVLIIDNIYTGVDVSVIVGSIYDLFPYEVFEFDINMGVYPTQKIQVNITQTDSRTGFDEVVYLSEIIDIKTRHAKTIEIYYYNDVNTDILYSTGIRNLIRIPIEYIAGGISDETENEKTDINTYLVNAEVYELDEFHFDLLSKQLMRKVTQALSHKFVFMDEVQYVKEASPESTPLVGTNLYRMVQSMVKADAVYTTQDTGEGFSAGTIEVPALLESTSGGFIKIKQ